MIKRAIRSVLNFLGYDIHRLTITEVPEEELHNQRAIPDEEFYSKSIFSPWKGYGDFHAYYPPAEPYTLVSPDRCYILLTLARQSAALSGSWLECGVYKGGTAMILSKVIQAEKLNIVLHLFDTFQGMPETDSHLDLHREGDFKDTNFHEVKERIRSVALSSSDQIFFHPGFIPHTFEKCGIDKISFAHIDVDIYRSVLDCCEFIYPRLVQGGFLLFDDYGFSSCPGARKAVDEFFQGKPELPIVLPTGQAIIVKYER